MAASAPPVDWSEIPATTQQSLKFNDEPTTSADVRQALVDARRQGWV